MKSLAVIIIAVVIGLFALWSAPAQAHGMHMDPTADVVAQDSEAARQGPAERCDAGHSCHAQVLPLVLAELAHYPAFLAVQHPLKARPGRSLSLAADPPPPRA
ncbi:hypothetical protein [Antarcticimicrobium luteum]|uniref:Uncharacterized protein n=1 Tax=Antarcticimicrobium luteum TaxID=2547397 RepID=A0A4R5VIP8_9RHOB|nr:hypothetical protein [Antarcticimicrobium luteum]TDK52975.1 hypothetical protein E1832_00945 [Antarcticimicrobium luteum]